MGQSDTGEKPVPTLFMFKAEIKVFERELPKLLMDGKKFIGTRQDYGDAIELAYEKCNSPDFMVKQILHPDCIEWVSHRSCN